MKSLLYCLLAALLLAGVLLALQFLPSRIPPSSSPSASLPASLETALDAYLNPAVEKRAFSGVVLVAQQGKPLFRKAYGFADWPKQTPTQPDTRFMIFSVTKLFTATLILRLQDQGKLSTNDPVSRHVAHWPKEWDSVTIHHLLTHSAGIDIDTLYFWLVKHHPEYWEDPAQTPPPYEPKPLLSKPGSTFRYSNAGYTILSRIASKVGGKPFFTLMHEEVFTPCNMKDTGFEGENPPLARARGHKVTPSAVEYLEQKTHFIVGAGDMISTVDDLLRWDTALYGDTLLSAPARQAMFTPYVRGKRGGFGYGWLLRDDRGEPPLPVFSGSGAGFSAYVIRRPEKRLFLAVLCNLEYASEFPFGMGVLDRVEAELNAHQSDRVAN